MQLMASCAFYGPTFREHFPSSKMVCKILSRRLRSKEVAHKSNRGELYRAASIFPPGNKSRQTYTRSQRESHRHTHTPTRVNTLIDRHTDRDTLEDNWMSRLMEKYHEMTNLSDDLSHFSANFSLRLYTEKKTNNVVQKSESPILERISRAFP